MNKMLSLIIATGFCTACYCQKSTAIKKAAIGLHFFYNDLETARNIRASSLKRVLEDGKIAKLENMSPGFAISYMQGLSNRFDISSSLSGSFIDYPLKNIAGTGSKKLLLEWDALLFAKMLNDDHLISPYLSAGIGGSVYRNHYGVFLPAGLGIQVNLFNEAFLLVNAQYRMKITENTNYHFYYSIGIAANIGKKRVQQRMLPPAIPARLLPGDRDHDDLADSLDLCPDEPGPIRLQGCPDTDNDGVTDKEDRCPVQPGFARYLGCPVPDTDSDGINDEEDKCPTLAGVARMQGCPVPDSDGDGINDEEDKCAAIRGVPENNGCPAISRAIEKKLAAAARNIFFATGSARLLATSAGALNTIVQILRESPDLELHVEGHTDNTGTAAGNLLLSTQRAQAVATYILKKGILPVRVSSAGSGSEKPMADNDTPQGKAKNRRVELKVHY